MTQKCWGLSGDVEENLHVGEGITGRKVGTRQKPGESNSWWV